LILAIKNRIFLLPINNKSGFSKIAWSIRVKPPPTITKTPSRLSATPVIDNRMMRVRTEDQVVPQSALGEIFSCVIDHVVGADHSRPFHIPRAAHGSHFGPERFGNLDAERTHAARRTVDQNFLARLYVAVIAETLKSSDRRDGHCCCYPSAPMTS
jgi:hypothetical protein